MRRAVCGILKAVVPTCLAFTVAHAVSQAPQAPSVPVTDSYHGASVPDPFRNLEDLKNPQTQAWLRAQADYAAATLSRIEGRDALRDRITQLDREVGERLWNITRSGGRIAYLKRSPGEGLPTLIVREGVQGAEQVLLDLNAMSRARGGIPLSVDYLSLSPDGRKLVYGLSAAGSEDASLHLVALPDGKPLRAPIERVPGMSSVVGWSPDGRWLGFNQLRALPPGAPDTETYMDSVVRVIDLRRPGAEPRTVFGPTVTRELGLDRLDVGQLQFGSGSRWMLVRTTDTTVPEGKLFIAPVTSLSKPGAIAWREISQASRKVTHVALRGDNLFVRSYAAAPRGQVLRVALPQADFSRAQVVVPEPARGVLQSFELGRRAIYAQVLEGFGSRTLRYLPGRTGSGVDVAPNLAGTVAPEVDASRPEAEELWLYSVTWTAPPRLYAAAPGSDALQDTGLLKVQMPKGAPELQVTEFEVASHDGVQVPVTVLHRRGLTLNGRNPTLLRGYGAYGMTATAGMDMRAIAWFERDGVLAYVNPRGSGAYGDAWHRAGFKASKPNTWKDGIAAARGLIARGYATPATLAVQGGSAGGIFAGRAMTEAPDLFAAAIVDVGLLDAVRAELSANGVTNISEFGTHKDPAEFRALLEMSTYHQVRDGVAYPAVLFTHGMNDPRVDPWHSAKAAARLQQANPGGKPVLLRLDAMAGHGGGETAQQQSSKQADRWAFLLWQFGLAGLRP